MSRFAMTAKGAEGERPLVSATVILPLHVREEMSRPGITSLLLTSWRCPFTVLIHHFQVAPERAL